MGRRTIENVGGARSYYPYSPDGLLLAETNAAGQAVTEYCYLEGSPLAVMQGNNLFKVANPAGWMP